MRLVRFLIPGIVLTLSLTPAFAEPGETFTMRSVDGREWTLPDDQQGVGIYLFWAAWCPYCKALMPRLDAIAADHGEAVTVFALNFRDEADAEAFVAERGYDFVTFEQADTVAGAWGARGTPAVWILDESGQVRFSLYDVLAETPEGWGDLTHAERAKRRVPFWEAEIREALQPLLPE